MITLFYDDTCILCTTNAVQMQAKNPANINIISVDKGIEILEKAGISRVQAMTYVCIQDEMGNILKGMDAVRTLCDVAGSWVSPWLHLPIIKQICHLCYPFFAKNRYYFPKWAIRLLYGKVAELSMADCSEGGIKGVCQIPPQKR